MNGMKEMIKQAMRDEMTLDDILQAVEEAREEVAEEAAICIDLDTARKDVVMAAMDYAIALGIFPKSTKFTEEDINTIAETLQKKEAELKEQTNMIRMMMPVFLGKGKDAVRMGMWRF